VGPHFFINRPIFASVLSIVIVLCGYLALQSLPVAQYPEITPPTISVIANYPGANAIDVARTVATPIELEVNGVERMLYMESKSTNDGQMNLTITFEVGTDLNMAQVLVQNRVNLALPKLPDVVKTLGVSTKKKSPSITLVVNVYSPDGSRDQTYLSNFATHDIKDELARLPGVGDVSILGEREYSLRIWTDPNKLANLGLTSMDVVKAIREQNQQVAAGQIGRPPIPPQVKIDYQNTINVLGRLEEVEQFQKMIIKVGGNQDGKSVRTVKLSEVARIELGAKNYDSETTLDGRPTVSLAIFQLPGSNALETAERIKEKMDELMKRQWPEGDIKKRNEGSIDYGIFYNTTPFIEESIHEVIKTLIEAIVLVAIVVLIFLQNWRSALIPLVAVPVAIIGTFAVLALFGFSLNNLTLFGLVLAIGIVVDDAIVVVESVEHHLAHGLSPKEATEKAMTEVTGPVVAVALVLCAVFVPTAFISGITGLFFQQFALTIAVSTVISAFNSLTLSPALCAILLKPKTAKRDPLQFLLDLTLGWFFKLFNKFFDISTNLYVGIVRTFLRLSLIILVVYGGLLLLTGNVFSKVPTGFIPLQDKGYLLIDIQMPGATSIQRTQKTVELVDRIGRSLPAVANTIGVPGQSVISGEFSSSVGTFFFPLKSFEVRHTKETYYVAVIQQFVGAVRQIQGASLTDEFVKSVYDRYYAKTSKEPWNEDFAQHIRECCTEMKNAQILAFGPPPVDGLGNAGGFKMMIQDRGSLGFATLQGMVQNVARNANAQPGLMMVGSNFRANTPQIEVKIDRENAMAKGVNLGELFSTLQMNLGSFYINDITKFDRNYQVNIQSDSQFRMKIEDIGRLRLRNNNGQMIALNTFAQIKQVAGPSVVTRYNQQPAAPIFGGTAPGVSSGQGIQTMAQIADDTLPRSMTYEWTDLSYQEVKVSNTTMVVFALSVLLVFLVLAAQYESWILPLAVILIVPMCLLCAAIGVLIANYDLNIFTQIGLVVLVGLASKNAILIVEFAKLEHEKGSSVWDAALAASRLRLRPILMTSFAFILGVVPLVLSEGAGAEMRRTLGTAVFSGMLGVTIFGIFFTPVFYYVLSHGLELVKGKSHPAPSAAPVVPAPPAQPMNPHEGSA
jgi:multidrug efflux pump